LLKFWKSLEQGTESTPESPSSTSDTNSNAFETPLPTQASGPGNLNVPATVNNRVVQKYQKLQYRLRKYEGENTDSIDFVNKVIEDAEKSVSEGEFPTVAETMKNAFGWSEADVQKYLDGNQLKAPTQVEYLDKDARKQYEITGSGILMQGDPATPFDTSSMFSKGSGAGFGIYVMSPNGELYSNAHKVGLFHHSSFLEGLPTAAAGEWKVEGGTLKHITNKSGHYRPDKVHLVQVLLELKERGISLSGVEITLINDDPYSGDAIEFLEDYQDLLHEQPKTEEDKPKAINMGSHYMNK
jgi:hypothetical protein